MVNTFGDIRPSNPVDYEGSNCNFWDNRKKLGFPTKYLRKYWTNLDQVFRLGRSTGANYKTDIVLRSPEGCCYGNQLIFRTKIILD